MALRPIEDGGDTPTLFVRATKWRSSTKEAKETPPRRLAFLDKTAPSTSQIRCRCRGEAGSSPICHRPADALE